MAPSTKPKVEKEVDLSVYATKAPTSLVAAFQDWIPDNTGYDPNDAKNKTDAFNMGVKLALNTHKFFQTSDDNRTRAAELKEARELEAAQKAEERAAKAEEREAAEAEKAEKRADREAAAERKAAEKTERDAKKSEKASAPAKKVAASPAKVPAKKLPAKKVLAKKAPAKKAASSGALF